MFNISSVALDYIPISLMTFTNSFLDLITNKKYSIFENKNDNIKKIYGYSCRSLFHTTMETIMTIKKKDLVIVTTPIHHTSFRNIIEIFVKPENIHIIELNKDYNGIKSLPNVEDCDIMIISHLFGQDLDYDMNEMFNFKNKHKCIFIEDRVQGGTLGKYFSSSLFDISFYSCGMDKRPVALGGGFMIINNTANILSQIYDLVILKMYSYKKESRWDRFLFLLKKIPTFLIYNYKLFYFLIKNCVKLVGFNENTFSEYYRKNNPGFAHNDYLVYPSDPLMKSLKDNELNFYNIETNYMIKSKKFMDEITKYCFFIKKENFPWYKDSSLLTPYNTILVNNEHHTNFRKNLLEYGISSIVNPTYKIFNHDYVGKDKDKNFNDSIIYIPSLGTLNDKDIKDLANYLNHSLKKIKQHKLKSS